MPSIGEEKAAEFDAAMAPYRHDPAGFVRAELGAEPETWQAALLAEIAEGLSPHEALRFAVASGHGVGKSALVAWLLLWAIATCSDTRGVVTANTEVQLRTKTWAELAKWFRRWRLASFFDFGATSLASRIEGHARTWRIDLVPWSEHNAEAFAGLHNAGRRVVVVFDEASAIADPIWETTEGALTDRDTEILWCVFGNPTRNGGRFRECFGRFRHRWRHRQVDARTVGLVDQAAIARWIADYGEDSDFVRVRVRGVFPRAGSLQFIASDAVEAACRREAPPPDPRVAPVLGVDVARFGDDRSVIFLRRGRDARSEPPRLFRKTDTMTLAGEVARLAWQTGASAIHVDAGGVGGGVVDRLNALGVPGVMEIHFAGRADGWQPEQAGIRYANKRAEMWGFMKEWLKHGALPDLSDLVQDLTGIEYGYDAQSAILLEKKDDMKRRGLASPDLGDALALTFAYPAPPPLRRL
jgi:hypothetical protein